MGKEEDREGAENGEEREDEKDPSACVTREEECRVEGEKQANKTQGEDRRETMLCTGQMIEAIRIWDLVLNSRTWSQGSQYDWLWHLSSIPRVNCDWETRRVVNERCVHFLVDTWCWPLFMICHQPGGICKCFVRIHSIPELQIQKQSESHLRECMLDLNKIYPHYCNSTWVSVLRGKSSHPGTMKHFLFKQCIYSLQSRTTNREKGMLKVRLIQTHHGTRRPKLCKNTMYK